MSQDELYSDRSRRLDTLAGPGNAAYWGILVRLSDQYSGEKDPMFGITTDWKGFIDWCDTNHGFRPTYDSGGGITPVPQITDQKKYTLCLLKYSG